MTLAETFTSASTSYTATATAGALNLSIDLTRPTGAASVVLTQGSSTSSVTVGTPNPVTGVATLATTTIAAGECGITVTSPDESANTTYTLTGEGDYPAMTNAIFAAAVADTSYIANASDQDAVRKGAANASVTVISPSVSDASEVIFSPATLSFTTSTSVAGRQEL